MMGSYYLRYCLMDSMALSKGDGLPAFDGDDEIVYYFVCDFFRHPS